MHLDARMVALQHGTGCQEAEAEAEAHGGIHVLGRGNALVDEGEGLARQRMLHAVGQKAGLVLLHRSEEHTSELQSPCNLVCRLLLEKKNTYHSDREPCAQPSMRICFGSGRESSFGRLSLAEIGPGGRNGGNRMRVAPKRHERFNKTF